MNDGGPAFPVLERLDNLYDDDFTVVGSSAMCSEGMKLRDYFAAKALAGLLADKARSQQVISKLEANGLKTADELLPRLHRAFARQAYEIADAMLAARDQKPEAK